MQLRVTWLFDPEYLDFLKTLIPHAELVNTYPIQTTLPYHHFKTNYDSKFVAEFQINLPDGLATQRVGISGDQASDLEIIGTQLPAVFNENYYYRRIVRDLCKAADPIKLPSIPENQTTYKKLIRNLRKKYPSRKLCEIDPKFLILSKVHCSSCNSPIKIHDSHMICAVTSMHRYNSFHLCKDSKICNFRSALV